MGATHPGINGKIACARTLGSGPTANTEIFSFNPNGTELEATNLTNSPAFEGRPKYSPDGRQIAYESSLEGPSEIYLMNADGTNVRRLTFTGGNSSASWHPDGSQIAFQSTRTGQFQIFKIFVDGTGEQQLTFHPQESTLPTWSPDGTRIAFSSRREDPDADVHIMDAFGGNVINLTNSPGEDSWPTWSPDGTQIGFHSRLDDPLGEEIYRIGVNGTGRTRLTFNTAPLGGPNSDLFPAWSPDGTRITWTSGMSGISLDAWHMNAVDGSDKRQVTSFAGSDQRCDWQPLCTIYGAGDIQGTAGNDIICGSDGPDRINGAGGNDRILGLGGDDQLLGGTGNDTLFGGLGNDSISGGVGSDFTSGGPGNDRIVAETGERIDIGAGTTDQCAVSGVAGCPPRLS